MAIQRKTLLAVSMSWFVPGVAFAQASDGVDGRHVGHWHDVHDVFILGTCDPSDYRGYPLVAWTEEGTAGRFGT